VSTIPESLGEAVLAVRLDTQQLTASLNTARTQTENALGGIERATGQATAKMAGTWREFVSQNLSTYRQLEGSHKAAMQRLGAEWNTYKHQAQTATQAVNASLRSTETAADRAGAAVATSTRNLSGTLGGLGRTLDGFSMKLAGLFAGGLIAGGITMLGSSMAGFASEADRAEKSSAAFGRALTRFNQDATAGNALVESLASRFGVLDTTVESAATLLLRAGASLTDVEKALTAAGASAAAQGTSIETAFNNVAIAVATGRSELLESSGIITNLGPVWQAYAKSVNKSVDELSQAEKVQAGVAAIFKESRFEIEEVDNAMAGMAGSTATANRAAAEVRREFGEALRPAVIEAQRAITGLLTVSRDVLRVFNDYPGVLAGVTTAVGTLTVALAVNKAGGLGAALASIPGLAATAGRAIALAFGPYGVAAVAIAAIAGLVAQVFADIRRAQAEAAQLEAWRKTRLKDESYAAASTLVDARVKLRELTDAQTKSEEALTRARGYGLKDAVAKIESEIAARRKEIAVAQTAVATAEKAAKARQAEVAAARETTNSNAGGGAAGALGDSIVKLLPKAKELVLALENAKGAEAIARAQAALEAFTNKNKDAQAAVKAVNDELARTAREARGAGTGANQLKTELENIGDAKFRQALGNATNDRLKELLKTYGELAPNAERYKMVLSELESRQKATTKATDDASRAMQSYLDGRRLQAYADGLENAKDKQLENAKATALAAGELDKVRLIDAEIDGRAASRRQKQEEHTRAVKDGNKEVTAYTKGLEAQLRGGELTAENIKDNAQKLADLRLKLKEAGVNWNELDDTVRNRVNGALGAQVDILERLEYQHTRQIQLTREQAQASKDLADRLEYQRSRQEGLNEAMANAAIDRARAVEYALFGSEGVASEATARYSTPHDFSKSNTVSGLFDVDGKSLSELENSIARLQGLASDPAFVTFWDSIEAGLPGLIEYVKGLRDAAEGVARIQAEMTARYSTPHDFTKSDLVSGLFSTEGKSVAELEDSVGKLQGLLKDRAFMDFWDGIDAGLPDLIEYVNRLREAQDGVQAIQAAMTARYATPHDFTKSDTLVKLIDTSGKTAEELEANVLELTRMASDPAWYDFWGSINAALPDLIRARDTMRELQDGIPRLQAEMTARYSTPHDFSRSNRVAALVESSGKSAEQLTADIAELQRMAGDDAWRDFWGSIDEAIPGMIQARDLMQEIADTTGRIQAEATDRFSTPRDFTKSDYVSGLVDVDGKSSAEILANVEKLQGLYKDPAYINFWGSIDDAVPGMLEAAEAAARTEQAIKEIQDAQTARYANYQAPSAGGTTLDVLREGVELGTISLEDYQAELQAAINRIMDLGDESTEAANEVARLNAELNKTFARPQVALDADARYANYGQGETNGDGLAEVREGYALGTVALSDYRTELELAIARAQAFDDGSLTAANTIKRLQRELDELNSPTEKILSGFTAVAGVLRSFDDVTLDGLATVIETGVSAFRAFSSGDILGGLATIATTLVTAFQAARKEAEAFTKATKDLQDSLRFASVDAVSTVRRERGGFLGLGSKQVREVDDFALNVAQTIEGAIVNGISDGFSQAIARGDYSLVGEALEKSIGQAVLDGLIDAFVRGEIIKNIIQPALNQYIEARKTPGLEDDRAAIAGLKAAAGEAADASEAFYNDVYKPIAQDFGLYGSGGQPGSVADLRNKRGDLQSQFDLATSDSERRNIQSQIDNLDWQINQMTGSASGGGPFGVSMPGIGIQSAIATPILESAQSFKLSTDALGVHIGVFGAAANLFNAATSRFDATITRLEQAAANGTAGLRYA
jgi:hypothetical protein